MRCINCKKNHSFIQTLDGYVCNNRENCYKEEEIKRKEYSKYNFEVGRKIQFENKRWWTITGVNDRYVICVRTPKNKDWNYTIIDLIDCIRGADNSYTKFNYTNPEECIQALKELDTEELKISYRNWTHLNITKFQ